MVELRADPWVPTYGAGAETPFDEEPSEVVVDAAPESSDWSSPVQPEPCAPQPLVFVDGVMRVDLRVLARDGDKRAWGLLGSYAAGAVTCDGDAAFAAEDEPVGRVLLLGGGVAGRGVSVRVGSTTLRYEARCTPSDVADAQRRALQRLMIDAEQRLAMRLAERDLVVADGPLHLPSGPDRPVVGLVKRMVTGYLTGEHAELLTRVQPGQRTPIFALGGSVLDRYAWYVRLLPRHPTWHELAGLVRCEVRMELGLEKARAIADAACPLLPAFAGRPGVDPRAPQNLTPVGALEARLRHRMGDATLIRRALTASLTERAA